MKKLSGVYLVIDPSMKSDLFLKLTQALKGGLGLIQIWNNWPPDTQFAEKQLTIERIRELAHENKVPVLMHEDWRIAIQLGLDGVHFDEVPKDWQLIREHLDGKIIGLTAGNDLKRIRWAHEQKLAYVSFCAMFPSPSVSSCEIVTPSAVREARQITDMPLFLSGGIQPDKLEELKSLDFQGVAVISGIMSANDPEQAVKIYIEQMKKFQIL
ncbi:MAG: thiamine phosphate synthase [Marinoscillum sp.]